jgi:enoyl-CoA hydratase/carnithine racemase
MSDILVTTRGSVAVVSLNRPEARNAVTLGMWRELAGIFSGLADDDDVRGVVLTGSGADFCVGADVTEFGRIRESSDQSAAYEMAVDACSAAIALAAAGTSRWRAISGSRIPASKLAFLPPNSRSYIA